MGWAQFPSGVMPPIGFLRFAFQTWRGKQGSQKIWTESGDLFSQSDGWIGGMEALNPQQTCSGSELDEIGNKPSCSSSEEDHKSAPSSNLDHKAMHTHKSCPSSNFVHMAPGKKNPLRKEKWHRISSVLMPVLR